MAKQPTKVILYGLIGLMYTREMHLNLEDSSAGSVANVSKYVQNFTQCIYKKIHKWHHHFPREGSKIDDEVTEWSGGRSQMFKQIGNVKVS